MNYMSEVEMLISRIPDTDNEIEILDFLKSEYENIKQISDEVIETDIYRHYLNKTKEYLEETKDYSLINRWIVFLNKLVNAPVSLMIY